MKVLLTFLLIFSTIVGFTQSKTKGEIKETKENYLIVDTPVLKGFQDPFIQLQAGKIAINVLVKSKKYLLMFTANQVLGEDTDFKKLKMEITKKGEEYDLNLSIIKTVKEKPVVDKSVQALKVEKRFLLLQIRKSMYELLYGKKYLEKIKKDLKKENKNDIKQLKSLLKKGEPPKKVADSLAQIISDIKLSKVLLEDRKKEFEEEKDKKLKRDKDLVFTKSNIYQALVRERKRLDRDKTDREFRGKNESDKSEYAGNSKNQKDSEKAPLESRDGGFGENGRRRNPFNKRIRPRGTRLFAQGAILNRNSVTDFVLKGFANDFNLAGVKGTARVEVMPGFGDDFVLSFFYLTNITETSLAIPDIKNFELMYLTTAGFLPFDMYFGAHYENQYFINIVADDGEGKTVVENQFLWFQVGIERVFKVWKLLIIPQFAFAKNLTSSSTLSDDVQLDGTKIELGGEIGYKNYRLGIKYMSDSVTANNISSFKTEQTSTFLTLSYVFM